MRRLNILIVFGIGFMIFFGAFHGAEAKSATGAKPTASAPEPKAVKSPDRVDILGESGNGNHETPGEWYVGATPPNLKPNAPILLFVQGLNSTAQTWWVDNDMYDTAYNRGYQTAFVQLYDAGGASADMWDNGALLADKIREIRSYFNNKPIVIIAHSKGGVDAQTALVYDGAWPLVDRVITLSSPHHGSQLADLAYSFWAGWLADLLGQQGDGTYVMQTGYMDYYRSITDSRPEAAYTPFYTLGGTDWGSAFSSTWFGGMYLSQYGDNDGVVTVASSRLPYGHEVAVGSWTHSTIHTGVTFPIFEPYLTGERTAQATVSAGAQTSEKRSIAADGWVHGGALPAKQTQTVGVAVEDRVKKVTVDIITTKPLADVHWIDPDGKTLTAAATVTQEQNDEGVFGGAYHHVVQLADPKAGNWTLALQAATDDAYLLTAVFESNNKVAVDRERLPQAQDDGAKVQIQYVPTVDKNEVRPASLKVTYRVAAGKSSQTVKASTVTGRADGSATLACDKDTVCNVTIDLEGVTVSGQPFKRTVIDSVYGK